MASKGGRFFLTLGLALILTGCSLAGETAREKFPAPAVSGHAPGQKPPIQADYYQSLPPYTGDRKIFEQSLAAMAEVKSYRLLAHTTIREQDRLKTFSDEEYDFVALDKKRFWKAVNDKLVVEEICLGATLYTRKGNNPAWKKREGAKGPEFPVTPASMAKDFQGARDIRLLMDGDWEGVPCLAVSFLLPPEVYPGVATRVNYFFEKVTNRIIRIERINEKKGRADYTETFYRFEDFNVAPDILPPQV